MKQIYYKQNEKFEYEFFNDKECKEGFEFKENENHLYIKLRDGNITPIIKLHDTIETNKNTETLNIFCIGVNSELALHFGKYICGADELNSQGCGIEPSEVQYYFLDLPNYDEIFSGYAFDSFHNITSNYSKYIPNDCAVVFLNEEDLPQNRSKFSNQGFFILPNMISVCKCKELNKFCKCTDEYSLKDCDVKKLIIFTKELTSANIKQINDTAKALKENFGIEWVGVFAELCFVSLYCCSGVFLKYCVDSGGGEPVLSFINALITTNATEGFEPLERELLKVIDCKEIFEEYIKTNE